MLERRLAALTEHLPAALDGRPASVHQARVASRRLREALPVVGSPAPARVLRKAVRRVRRVTRALGPVRELDVALGLLDEVAASRPELVVPLRLVRRVVIDERRRRRAAMLDAIDGTVDATIEAVAKVVGHLRTGSDDGPWRTFLAGRIAGRSETLRASVEDVGLLFDPIRLHLVRIAAKKLRYALEIANEARLAATTRQITALKRTQERLGRLHDYQVLLVFARAAEIDGVPRFRKSLSPVRDLIERECHREHGRYLRRRQALLAVCDAAGARAQSYLHARHRPGRVVRIVRPASSEGTR
jgi:CHAD domain-containing protein